jgi:hypothetical protein
MYDCFSEAVCQTTDTAALKHEEIFFSIERTFIFLYNLYIAIS